VEAVSLSTWVRALRSPKLPIEDPARALSWFWERERDPESGEIATLTVLLAGAECPFTCVFCDLWRQTLDGPTPRGALPAQLRAVLGEAGSLPGRCAIKLYNASNFFDPRAVPPEDDAELAALLAPFARITVECHPRLLGERCASLARRLRGRLEVAIGLETIHPEALARLNKGMTVGDFDSAAARLREIDIALRVFVLVGAPFLPPERAVEWAVRSAQHALERGALRVSLIPVREGNGSLEELRRRGDFTPPTLEQLEEAFDRSLKIQVGKKKPTEKGIVTVDLWDLDRFASCPACLPARRERLARMNLSGRIEPRVVCPSCGLS
jgi:radical SAM enzyme (TIGR01210 family)